MKTEQEQIKEMSNIITDCLCKNCDDCKYYNGHFCTEKNTGRAEALIQAGYGDVSEYKAEIERLKEVVKNYKEVLCETTQRKDDAIELNDKLVEEYESKNQASANRYIELFERKV